MQIRIILVLAGLPLARGYYCPDYPDTSTCGYCGNATAAAKAEAEYHRRS